MKIASFNVNGIKARITTVVGWLKESKPDVVVLQEIKSTNDTFPKMEIEDLGYNIVTHGQKSFNGVAILSLFPIEQVKIGLNGNTQDLQSRWIEAEINTIRICGLYLPNGNPCPGTKFDYKIEWMDRFYERAAELIGSEQATVILGDYNVIPQAEDAADPELWVNDALYHHKTRSRFQRIINLGFTDALRALHPTEKAFTFWDYQRGSWQKNNGIRIDHVLLSPQAADQLKSCQIDSYLRGEERPSDHVPICIELSPNDQFGAS
ncbi:MAG: exodeoxyribonuclease III [Paracoccaceae bacterium]|nr:exodeoxyribonuclease III [Paracoccaceae bacterium]